DPFADAPVLRVVPLPEGKALKSREAWGLLDKYRCVAVSGGKLRFVDMYRNRNSGGSAQIGVWTLADPDSTEWTLEYEATFTEIWDDASYKAIGLPRKIPVLALIHPTNPDVVYFFLDEHLLGVDVRARKVVECEVYELVAPPSQHVGTRFVHAWQLPQALCSDDDVTCPFQSSRVPKPVCKFFLPLQVFIRHGGPTLSLQVKLDEPSKLMMNTLRTRTRNYFADIYVCYGLKVIHPDHTLRSYGVLNNCTIKLSGRIRGGLQWSLLNLKQVWIRFLCLKMFLRRRRNGRRNIQRPNFLHFVSLEIIQYMSLAIRTLQLKKIQFPLRLNVLKTTAVWS
uniref:DUF1618 domain-containing protein n=1 Tax=Aegilops tauschii subsp. strangulata TaxID=200361 RepID=A0A453EKG7_AEGTS